MEKVFPDVYPEDLLERIIEDGAEENVMENVYRIANYGNNDRDAFLSTFLTQINAGLHNDRDSYVLSSLGQIDIGQYSTSLSISKKRAKRILKMIERKYGGPILLKGTIHPEYGLSMLTKDSKSNRTCDKDHIDWWLYDNADPSAHFKIIELEEV